MDDSAAENPPRSQLLAELADELGMPVIAIASGWSGHNVVDLGEEGARAFIEVLDAEIDAHRASASRELDALGLFLVARGGLASFADGVWRALRERGIETTAIVAHRVDGASSLLASSSHHRIMHPYGALGAYDRRPLGRIKATLDADTLRGLDGLAEAVVDADERLVALAAQRRHAQLCGQLLRRMLGGSDSGLGARVERRLGADALGVDLALSARELDELGLATTVAQGTCAKLTWQLYLAYERELEVLEVAMPRFTESQVADEVEFAPATGLTGAVIESAHDQLVFELDTGRPDPDTGMLDGEWLWNRTSSELLEL